MPTESSTPQLVALFGNATLYRRAASADFCGVSFVDALAQVRAQPGSQEELRKKPRSPLTSTLGSRKATFTWDLI